MSQSRCPELRPPTCMTRCGDVIFSDVITVPPADLLSAQLGAYPYNLLDKPQMSSVELQAWHCQKA